MQHESTCQVPFSYRPVRYPFSPTLPTSAQFHWQVGGIFHKAIAAAKRCRLRALAPPLPLGNFVGSYFAFCVSTLQKLHMESLVIDVPDTDNDNRQILPPTCRKKACVGQCTSHAASNSSWSLTPSHLHRYILNLTGSHVV